MKIRIWSIWFTEQKGYPSPRSWITFIQKNKPPTKQFLVKHHLAAFVRILETRAFDQSHWPSEICVRFVQDYTHVISYFSSLKFFKTSLSFWFGKGVTNGQFWFKAASKNHFGFFAVCSDSYFCGFNSGNGLSSSPKPLCLTFYLELKIKPVRKNIHLRKLKHNKKCRRESHFTKDLKKIEFLLNDEKIKLSTSTIHFSRFSELFWTIFAVLI